MTRGLAGLGVVLVVAGVFWALQGAGVIMWPAQSFMLQQESWVTYGIVTALVGVALIGLSRRSRR
jgi:hypothetical protein